MHSALSLVTRPRRSKPRLETSCSPQADASPLPLDQLGRSAQPAPHETASPAFCACGLHETSPHGRCLRGELRHGADLEPNGGDHGSPANSSKSCNAALPCCCASQLGNRPGTWDSGRAHHSGRNPRQDPRRKAASSVAQAQWLSPSRASRKSWS